MSPPEGRPAEVLLDLVAIDEDWYGFSLEVDGRRFDNTVSGSCLRAYAEI